MGKKELTCEEHWEDAIMDIAEATVFLNEAEREGKEISLICISDAYNGLSIARKSWVAEHKREMGKAIELLAYFKFQHPDKCSFDHSGNCQEHGLLFPIQQTKEYLEKMKSGWVVE